MQQMNESAMQPASMQHMNESEGKKRDLSSGVTVRSKARVARKLNQERAKREQMRQHYKSLQYCLGLKNSLKRVEKTTILDQAEKIILSLMEANIKLKHRTRNLKSELQDLADGTDHHAQEAFKRERCARRRHRYNMQLPSIIEEPDVPVPEVSSSNSIQPVQEARPKSDHKRRRSSEIFLMPEPHRRCQRNFENEASSGGLLDYPTSKPGPVEVHHNAGDQLQLEDSTVNSMLSSSMEENEFFKNSFQLSPPNMRQEVPSSTEDTELFKNNFQLPPMKQDFPLTVQVPVQYSDEQDHVDAFLFDDDGDDFFRS